MIGICLAFSGGSFCSAGNGNSLKKKEKAWLNTMFDALLTKGLIIYELEGSVGLSINETHQALILSHTI